MKKLQGLILLLIFVPSVVFADNGVTTILTNEDLTGVTLADVHRPSGGGPIKSKPVHTEFRYSTIVERYLATHKYETFNNIKGWKMLITHNTEAQKAIDLKFA